MGRPVQPDPEKQWLEARRKGIGGSDAACILGLNPWKTNVQLWEEKTGFSEPEDISDKPAVIYGKQAEAPIRSLFLLDHPEYSSTYDQYGLIANDPQRPWLFATLDGELFDWQKNPGVLEVKTTEIKRSQDWAKWDNRVPNNYYIQILHQLLATGYGFAWLVAQIKWHKGDMMQKTIREYHFERADLLDDLQYLRDAEDKFWWHVENKVRPALILPEI